MKKIPRVCENKFNHGHDEETDELSVTELKSECEEHDLETAGKKVTLERRLNDYLLQNDEVTYFWYPAL